MANGKYNVALQAGNTQNSITVTPGTALAADSGGVLVFTTPQNTGLTPNLHLALRER